MSNYISREAAIELLHYNADERCSVASLWVSPYTLHLLSTLS